MDYNIYNCKNCHSQNLDHKTYTVMCKDCGFVEQIFNWCSSIAYDPIEESQRIYESLFTYPKDIS
jgi:transcription initiation factor TFIIIB Brf1 subunit/transcription initiation factor TFIIB